jgi:hypothetical protein
MPWLWPGLFFWPLKNGGLLAVAAQCCFDDVRLLRSLDKRSAIEVLSFTNGVAQVSPLASFFLLLRQKKETKEKATPDRSKARNKINSLRQMRKLAIC